MYQHNFTFTIATSSSALQIHTIEGREGKLVLQDGVPLPPVTITSYEMARRLTCPACMGSTAHAAYEQLRAQVQSGYTAGGWGLYRYP